MVYQGTADGSVNLEYKGSGAAVGRVGEQAWVRHGGVFLLLH